MTIGNWIHNSLTENGLMCVEFKRNLFSYYHPDHLICMVDGPSTIKVELDLIKSEAKISTREIKDNLRNANITACEVDISQMLQDV